MTDNHDDDPPYLGGGAFRHHSFPIDVAPEDHDRLIRLLDFWRTSTVDQLTADLHILSQIIRFRVYEELRKKDR